MWSTHPKYFRAVHQLMELMQSKLLEYMRVHPLADPSWSRQFSTHLSYLIKLERDSPQSLQFSTACQALASHILSTPQRESRKRLAPQFTPSIQTPRHRTMDSHSLLPLLSNRRPKQELRSYRAGRGPRRLRGRSESRYYNDLMDKLLREERFKGHNAAHKPTLTKTGTSLMEDRDFWLIDNNIQFVKANAH